MTQPEAKRLITERKSEHGGRLGRHVLHDPRSRDYVAEEAKRIQDVEHTAHGLPLTQTRGSCTAEALVGALDSDPDFKGTVLDQAQADRLYDEEIELEGGDPAIDDPGGTGIMVCKAAIRLGLITSYRWCFSLNGTLRALTIKPVIAGVNWYEGCDRPDADGFVHIAGEIRGGHEFVLDAISVEQRAVGAWNSWGPTWGPLGGRFWMLFDDLERLLHEQGDVTVPVP